MKKLLLLFVCTIIMLSLSCKRGVGSDCNIYNDSIVMYFRPIFSSAFVDANELADLASSKSVDTIIHLNNKDFNFVKEIITHNTCIETNRGGVPEIMLKSEDNILFLTWGAPYAADIDGNPMKIDYKTAFFIDSISKLYNYYTIDELELSQFYHNKKLPSDYHYYFDRYKDRNSTTCSPVIMRKKGIKIWLVTE